MMLLRRTRTLLLATLACVLATAPPPSAQGTDVTPPTVTGRSPSPGATGVSALVSVRAVFSEAVQPPTVTMVLRNAGNQVVAAQSSYDPATLTATLDPDADLGGNEVFTLTVSGTRDLAGNAMATTSWSFTTAASQFVDELTPQSGLTQPTVIEFASDGRLFVAQKDGRVWVFDNLADATPTLVADLRLSVYNFWDRGLLGMALHPSFPSVPYLYVLYTHDAIPGGTAPRWGVSPYTNDGCPSPPGATGNGCVVTGRLSRLDVGTAALWPLNHANEQPLITDWPQQFPSHSTGALVFGSDGALYASAGDGASFNYVDYGQTASTPTIADPVNEGGALRSQDLRTSGDPVTLDGAVIRIDPDTGLALPDNPRWASDTDPNGRRIVGFGLRNPFRITTRPGTRELWVGDVGWSGQEEVNRLVDPIDAGVDNFGWPCYEGPGRQSGYDSANLPVCENLYSAGASAVVAPHFSYAHGASLQGCAAGSSSISGLAFYPTTGGTYPSSYAGALFFADYSRRCIWAMRTGADGLPNPADVTLVQSAPSGPVNLTTGLGGDIFYPGFNDNRLHRLRYPGNLPPDAVLQGSPTAGPAPLNVSFSAAGSTDPEAGALTYAWDLDGDGAFDDGTGASASWIYTSGGVVQARVLVTDAAGLSDVAGLTILVGAGGPTAIIDTPSSTTTWRVGNVVLFSGRATDPDEPGGIPASRLSWDVIIQHCPSDCHTHAMQSFVGTASGAFTAPDHEYPSYLQLRLTATDATGLQDTASVNLQPATVPLTFTTNPPGLSLGVNAATGVAPFTRTVIIGSSNSTSAPAEQQLGGVTYQFSSWSDGLPPNHNIIAPGTPTTWTATYTVASVPTGLVAAYGMNEGSGGSIGDWTGSGHTGTISGASWSAQGRFGSALQFDGVNDLVTIADAADLDPGAALTLEAWVYPTALSGWRTVALKESPSGLAYALYAHDDVPQWAGYINAAGGQQSAVSTAALPLNTWSHLAMTYDGTTLRIYRDGTQVGTRAITGGILATSNALRLGGNTVWGDEWFSGRIDEVRMYRRALSAAEIGVDMTTPVGGTPPPDTTNPTAAITAPASGATVRGSVALAATASDNVGVQSVQFYVDGVALGAPDTSAPYQATWDSTTATAGTHAITARAVDAAGNQGVSAPVSVTVDNDGPGVTVTSPASGATVTGTVTVAATATDVSGVASVQFLLNGAALGALDTSAPYAVSWGTTGVLNGAYQLSARATDAVGNQRTSVAVTVTVANVGDTTPPVVSITAPAPLASVSGTVTVSANASDASGIASVQFFLNGSVLGTADTSAPYSVSWNTTQIANGAQTLTAMATDGTGLPATSSPVTVTVANTWTVPSGIVAAYTFSEGTGGTVADASGGGRTGTISGATWTAAGRFGSAMSFDGVNDWVTVADTAALDLTSGMTMEAWVYPTALGGWRTVAMKESSGGLSYALYADDDVPSRPAGYVNRASRFEAVQGTGPLPLNTWTHIAVTYGGGALRFFVNGTQVSSVALTGNILTTTNPLRLGGNAAWGEYFAGRLDEVRIYNRALTATEIAAGMNQTIGGS